MNLKKIYQNKYQLIVIVVFSVLLLSRLLFLGSDLPKVSGITVEIEEKPVGINARNMVFLNHWPAYLNWCQPMVYAPLPNMVSYIFFQLFGVGLTQFRLPFAIASFLGLIFLYLIFSKQTNRYFALFGVLVYSLIFEVTVWNRSALPENLYLLFMPLSIYFLSKDFSKSRNIFAFVFFSAINMIVKTDGYPFFLATIIFLIIWAFIKKSFNKVLKSFIFGSSLAGIVYIVLFSITDSFKYFIPMYEFLSKTFVANGPLISRIIPSFKELITLMIRIDPYILISFLLVIPVLLIKHSKFNRVDWFMLLFLFFTFCTRFTIPAYLIYWKRIMFLFFPLLYFIVRGLFLLWDKNKTPRDYLKKNGKILLGLIIITFSYFLVVPYLFYDKFVMAFHINRDSFYFMFCIYLIILGIYGFSLFAFSKRKWLIECILFSFILSFALISLTVNILKVIRIYFPENIKYSYQENIKYAKLIPENEMIISDEQGVRGLEYLSKHDFYYNADGGPNPIVYREVIDRKDLRYFILDVAGYERSLWGIPNKVRLELIKEVYPNLKLLGVMNVSNIPMAIYDKYGNK